MKGTEAKVGAFVLLSAAVLCGTVYAVSGAKFRGARVAYRTYLRYAGGLEPGTAVLFGGIAVGRVTAVGPSAADPTQIEIGFDVKQGTPLNAKSVAKLGTVSLMASPVISITTGTNDAARLPPGAAIPSQETISLDDTQRKLVALADSARTLMSSVGAHLDELSADTRRLLSNLNEVTGAANRRRLASILANADAMVVRTSSTIDRIGNQVLKLTADADGMVENANSTITSVRQPLEADLGELRMALEQARALIGSLQAVVRSNSDNIHDVIENVRRATDNLNDVTSAVKERPWSLIRIKQPKDRQVPQQ
jgi:ABC-type transporter Mla subunit MlaD